MPGRSTTLADNDPLFKPSPPDAEFDPAAVQRPRVRGDCLPGGCNADRPCPWLSCRQNLLLDVHPQTGRIALLRPLADIEAMPYTCALDVADLGGVTLEEAGGMLAITRERVRQIEEHGLYRLRRGLRGRRLSQFADEGRTVVHPARRAASVEPSVVAPVEKLCPKCREAPSRSPGQSYCAACALAYEHERYLRKLAQQEATAPDAGATDITEAESIDDEPEPEAEVIADLVRNPAPEGQ